MFPFFSHYPGTDLHEIDLAYILKLCAELRASNTTLTEWKATHEQEYAELANKVEGLINNLVEVISPWDSSIAYHIFSIVEYQGTNYIAIEDVPVGTMITNTDYWQPANTALEQINAIGVRVDEIEDNLYFTTPEYFGAAGDGTTDDTDAFTAALATGKIIELSAEKTYRVRPSVLLISTPTVINGNGATIFCDPIDGANGYCFRVEAEADFRNLTIESSDDYAAWHSTLTLTGTSSNIYGINIAHENVNVENVRGNKLFALIYFQDNVTTITSDNATINNVVDLDSNFGLFICRATGVIVSNSKFVLKDDVTDAYSHALYIAKNTHDIYINNCIFVSHSQNVATAHPYGQDLTYGMISSVIINDCVIVGHHANARGFYSYLADVLLNGCTIKTTFAVSVDGSQQNRLVVKGCNIIVTGRLLLNTTINDAIDSKTEFSDCTIWCESANLLQQTGYYLSLCRCIINFTLAQANTLVIESSSMQSSIVRRISLMDCSIRTVAGGSFWIGGNTYNPTIFEIVRCAIISRVLRTTFYNSSLTGTVLRMMQNVLTGYPTSATITAETTQLVGNDIAPQIFETDIVPEPTITY